MASAVMHIYLAFMSILRVFTDVVDKFPGCYKSTQLVAVLLQMMNLCNMLHLFGQSTMNRHKERSDEAELIKFWILVEILMILVTILVPTIYLFARSLAFREQIIDKEARTPYGDETKIKDEIELSKKDYDELKITWKEDDDFDVLERNDKGPKPTVTVAGTWKNLKKIIMPEDFQNYKQNKWFVSSKHTFLISHDFCYRATSPSSRKSFLKT